MYTYIQICAHMYMCMHIFIYKYVHVHFSYIHTHIYVYAYIYLYICICTFHSLGYGLSMSVMATACLLHYSSVSSVAFVTLLQASLVLAWGIYFSHAQTLSHTHTHAHTHTYTHSFPLSFSRSLFLFLSLSQLVSLSLSLARILSRLLPLPLTFPPTPPLGMREPSLPFAPLLVCFNGACSHFLSLSLVCVRLLFSLLLLSPSLPGRVRVHVCV